MMMPLGKELWECLEQESHEAELIADSPDLQCQVLSPRRVLFRFLP